MMYSVVDFRVLVEIWFNEFLPERVDMPMLRDLDALYLKSIPFDRMKPDSLKFMLDRIKGEDGNGSESISIVAQEPRPVNNLKNHNLLAMVESRGSPSSLEKVLHLANRRYSPTSSVLVIPPLRELDDFMDDMFVELSRTKVDWLRTYAIESLDMDDFRRVFHSFFPKRSIQTSPLEGYAGRFVKVMSNNAIFNRIRGELGCERPDAAQTKAIENTLRAMYRDMEGLV